MVLIRVCVCWFAMLGLAAVCADQPKVLLIGIDGLRSDALVAADTPNLDDLAKAGAIDLATRVTSDEVTTSDTVSGPGWSTFLTGTWADRHGVIDNSFEGRDRQRGRHVFELAKAVRPGLRTASLVNWPPIDQFITKAADINVVIHPPPSAVDPSKRDYAAADARLAAMACETIKHDPVDIVFVYFGAVDETGHAHGFHPSVKPYVQQIETVDSLLGKLREAVSSRSTIGQENWLTIVSTDHGGEGFGHGGGRAKDIVRTAPMIVSGTAASNQSPGRTVSTTDVVAVALRHLGIEADESWGLAGSYRGWLRDDSLTVNRPPSRP